MICETTSGGVKIAPTTNAPTSTYWRLLASCLGVTKPVLTSSTSATGVSNAKPKATKIVRSEEHTSELQSLMRISYAVFCLKKKKNTQKPTRQRLRQK